MPESAPSRREVRARLLALASGGSPRRTAADWAAFWVRMDIPPPMDDAVWRALTQLSGADLEVSPGEFLHGEADFLAWLDEFDRAGSSE